MLSVPRLPFSLDPLIAEAKRRARTRQLLVVAAALVIGGGIAGAVVGLRSPGGGIGSGTHHRYTFSVESVNSSKVVNDVKYVSIVSPVVLSRKKLTYAPLFNITGAFHLVKKSAQGSVVCSFTKKITDSTTFPNANGKTVAVTVYGQKSPLLTARICRAFETFSLSWLNYEKLHGAVASNAGLGPFNGISGAQHTKTGTDLLPPKVLAQIKQMNAQTSNASQSGLAYPRLLPDTARVLGTAPDGARVYGLTDTRGDLCLFGAMGGGCGPPLSKTHPITLSAGNPGPIPPGGTLTVGGVAMDGVTSVSFHLWSKPVTVPVEHNVYIYVRPNSTATGVHCIVAHFADGSTVNAFPEGKTVCP